MSSTVAIFRSQLGRPEQSFIFQHAARLSRYEPLIVASNYAASYDRHTNAHLPQIVLRNGALGLPKDMLFRSLHRSATLRRALRRHEVRLVHAHFGPDALRILPLVRSLGLPLVTTFHGFDATRTDAALRRGPLGERRYARGRAELGRRGTLHLAVSEFIRRRLLERGFPEEKTILHHLGVDTRYFFPGGPVEPGLVVFVGRLEEEKGCLDVLEVMRRLHANGCGARLVMLGDGSLRPALETAIEQGRLRCDLLGTQPLPEVRRWMQRAAVVCGPSRTARNGGQEGFGLVYAEAQATATPVVAYATGGVAEAIEDGSTGLLAEEGGVDQLTAHVRDLLRDPRRAEAMGRRGRERVLTHFDVDAQSRRLETIYDDVVEQPVR